MCQNNTLLPCFVKPLDGDKVGTNDMEGTERFLFQAFPLPFPCLPFPKVGEWSCQKGMRDPFGGSVFSVVRGCRLLCIHTYCSLLVILFRMGESEENVLKYGERQKIWGWSSISPDDKGNQGLKVIFCLPLQTSSTSIFRILLKQDTYISTRTQRSPFLPYAYAFLFLPPMPRHAVSGNEKWQALHQPIAIQLRAFKIFPGGNILFPLSHASVAWPCFLQIFIASLPSPSLSITRCPSSL